MVASEQEIIEEELVYGALRRERLWQRLGLIGLIFGIQVDDLGVTTAFEVEYSVVVPAMLVITDQTALGISGKCGFAGA